jgi:two-component system OmpR family response regulator
MKTEKLSIFVVDDSSVSLDAITRELQRTVHCHVKGFTSAEDCIFRMEDGLPDLVLSDYYLDGLDERKMNGDQMLARIKIKYPHIPVIMYSSKNSVEVVIRLMKLGAVDFVTKEKNFIKTLSDITLKQINQIRTDHDTAWLTRGMLFVLAAFIGSLLLIHTFIPDAIGYFIVGAMIFLCVAAFSVNTKPQDHPAGNSTK